MQPCPIRIAIGRFDETTSKWKYHRIQTTLGKSSAVQDGFDATIGIPNHERLAQAAEYLTSLGYGGLEDLLAEYYAVTRLQLKDVEHELPQPVKSDLWAAGANTNDNDGLSRNNEQDRLGRAGQSGSAATQVTRPQRFVVISSSDHDEPTRPRIENMKNGRATIRGHRGRFSTANGDKRKRSLESQLQRATEARDLPYKKISKPNSSVRRGSRIVIEEPKPEILKPIHQAKVEHAAYSTLSSTAVSDAAGEKARCVADIIDLCSTDSENVPP